ncbi:MAG: DUF1080 domain-containing protein [Verrucomicrobia bacterium]|nr:DUF1080 domain-containing protein [Verrucomicrobiota bacterium]
MKNGVLFLWGVLSAATAFAGELEPGFVSIFNGKDLSGWDGDPRFWSVKDGAICGQTTPENPTSANTFLIWEGGEVKDFVVRLDYKITGNNPEKWGNSGVQYRSQRVGQEGWSMKGYQADIDTSRFYTGILYEENGRGILSLRGESTFIKKDSSEKTVLPNEETTLEGVSGRLKESIHESDWNSYSIRVETLADSSTRITHTINGQLLTYVVDASGAGARSGLLGLQLHAGQSMKVEFKNIRVKKLKD